MLLAQRPNSPQLPTCTCAHTLTPPSSPESPGPHLGCPARPPLQAQSSHPALPQHPNPQRPPEASSWTAPVAAEQRARVPRHRHTRPVKPGGTRAARGWTSKGKSPTGGLRGASTHHGQPLLRDRPAAHGWALRAVRS